MFSVLIFYSENFHKDFQKYIYISRKNLTAKTCAKKQRFPIAHLMVAPDERKQNEMMMVMCMIHQHKQDMFENNILIFKGV